MIPRDRTLQYLYLVTAAYLTHQFSKSNAHRTHQYRFAIFRDPNEMVLNTTAHLSVTSRERRGIDIP